jgi:hypothetical protein
MCHLLIVDFNLPCAIICNWRAVAHRRIDFDGIKTK